MSEKIESFAKLVEVVKEIKGPVAILGHARPDADSIGSSVGLVEILKARGVEAIAMMPEAISPKLEFLWKDVPHAVATPELLKKYTVISVDVAASKLFDPLRDVPVALAIDHHLSHTPFAENYFVNPNASSASQIIAEIACEMGGISLAGATALYAGMLADTGNFAWGNAGEHFAHTMEVAAWLVRQGVAAKELSDILMGTVSRSYLKLLCYATEKAEFLEDGAIVLVGLNEEEYKKLGAEASENKDSLIAALRAIEGVKIAALVNYKEGKCKASVRSRSDKMQVNKFCEIFGGGGHACAAGIGPGINEPLETFLPRFKDALLSHWRAYGQASR